MKYVSMKMDPNGSRPPVSAMTGGRRYHCLVGDGRRDALHAARVVGHAIVVAPHHLRGREEFCMSAAAVWVLRSTACRPTRMCTQSPASLWHVCVLPAMTWSERKYTT